MKYVADYDSRKMLKPECIHNVSLMKYCGTCEHEIQEGEAMGLGEASKIYSPWEEEY